MKFFLRVSRIFLLNVLIFLPIIVFAEDRGAFFVCEGVDCNLSHLVQLGGKIIDFLILISVPLAAIMFAYAGFLMVTASGNSSQIDKAKGIFWKVGIGFFFVLSAWLIVNLIVSALLNEKFILLKNL